jgi:hypothetical protein
MPIDDGRTTRITFGPADYALLAIPWGWTLVWLRAWNAYHDQHHGTDTDTERERDEPGAQYGRAPIDWLDHLLLLAPYGWLVTALRHAESLLSDSSVVPAVTIGSRGVRLPAWAESTLALGGGLLSAVGLGPRSEPPRPRRRRATARMGRAAGRGLRARTDADPPAGGADAPAVAAGG